MEHFLGRANFCLSEINAKNVTWERTDTQKNEVRVCKECMRATRSKHVLKSALGN